MISADNKKGLACFALDTKYGVAIDPDSVFWGIIPQRQNSEVVLSRKMLSLYEKVRDDLDKQMWEFRFNSNLSAIYINLTDRCNANCPYCYIPEELRRDGNSMNEKQLEYVLEQIAEYFEGSKRKPVVVFHASEPLLVKDIVFKAINDFSSRFYFGLQTNALLLEKADVEFLKEHKVGVGISLDSFDPKVNNSLRPTAQLRGNYHKVAAAIEWFCGYEGLNVITTVTRLNVTHLPQMIEFLHIKKVPCVLFNPVRMTQKSARSLQPNEKLLTEYFIKAIDKAVELSRVSEQKIIIGNFANIILGIVAPAARRLMCDISPCGGGRCFLTITATGDMIPCGEFIGLKGFSGGNIFKTTISKAMQSNSFKRIRSRVVEKITECAKCVFRNICGAPCPAELYSLGNMYQKAIFCEFYKEIIKYAFKLIAEEKERYLLRPDSLKNLQHEYQLT